ncbi:MAG TPA: FecR domain-containing protein [Rhizomicrobium sp.]|jgi:transmembrane sensor
MSDPAIPAEDIETRAAEWIVARRVREDWDDARAKELDAWLAQSPAHTVAYLRLDNAWGRTERLAALRPPTHGFRFSNVLPRLWPALVKAVAALSAIAVIGYFVLAPKTSHERIYATALGGHDVLKLSDGSQVELDTDTVLRINLDDKRRVWLDKGQAYFQIAHDPHHPFTVTAANRKVTVLGTKFLMRQEPQRLEVSVMEGRVRLESAEGSGQQRSALLALGDDAVATQTAMVVTRKTPRARAQEMAWRRGLLVFDQRTLGDAASELNRYNSRKLVIADPQTAALIIGGTFRTNDVEAFTRVVREILGVQAQIHGGNIVISRPRVGG